MKKIIINCNDCFAIYKFRLELILELKKIYDVYLIAKHDMYYEPLKLYGIDVINSEVNSTSKNILKDIKLYRFYKDIFRKITPDVIINYTIKPHIYGALAARNTKVINFVSGTGSVFLEENITLDLVTILYRTIKRKVNKYIFINKDDYNLFIDLGITNNNSCLIKTGEGVNLDKFIPVVNYKKPITFIFIGRLIKEKGILEYLQAATIVKRKYPNVRFLVVGDFYKKKSKINYKTISYYIQNGVVEYLGYMFDVVEILKEVHVVVLPSEREGLPISLIEGLASKKVIIASNTPGCKDVVIDGVNGFLSNRDPLDIAAKMINYINYPNKEKLHNNAYQSSNKYDKKYYIEEMVKIIEEI